MEKEMDRELLKAFCFKCYDSGGGNCEQCKDKEICNEAVSEKRKQ